MLFLGSFPRLFFFHNLCLSMSYTIPSSTFFRFFRTCKTTASGLPQLYFLGYSDFRVDGGNIFFESGTLRGIHIEGGYCFFTLKGFSIRTPSIICPAFKSSVNIFSQFAS